MPADVYLQIAQRSQAISAQSAIPSRFASSHRIPHRRYCGRPTTPSLFARSRSSVSAYAMRTVIISSSR
jgi:hypothetical protein